MGAKDFPWHAMGLSRAVTTTYNLCRCSSLIFMQHTPPCSCDQPRTWPKWCGGGLWCHAPVQLAVSQVNGPRDSVIVLNVPLQSAQHMVARWRVGEGGFQQWARQHADAYAVAASACAAGPLPTSHMCMTAKRGLQGHASCLS
jgi:hypothetical protein